jgi:hypothetical protein
MAEDVEREGTLQALHHELGELRQEVGEVKALIARGLKTFPPEWPSEVLRLLREANRLSEERFAQLDVAIREHALETHTILRALAESQRHVVDGQRQVIDGQRQLVEAQRQLAEEVRQVALVQRLVSEDIKALIARIDALIKGREDGERAR